MKIDASHLEHSKLPTETWTGIQELREELVEIQRSLDLGEELRASLWTAEEPALGDLEQLVCYWEGVVQGAHRERELSVLLPCLERAGFPSRTAPIVLLHDERTRAGGALGRLGAALDRSPAARGELDEALAEFLRLTRLRADIEQDLLVVLADLLADEARLEGAEGQARLPGHDGHPPV